MAPAHGSLLGTLFILSCVALARPPPAGDVYDGPAIALLPSAIAVPATAAPRVAVDLYAEALCPYCAKMLTEVARPLVSSELADILDFRLIPYGNARRDGSDITCQHGPDECALNALYACTMAELSGGPGVEAAHHHHSHRPRPRPPQPPPPPPPPARPLPPWLDVITCAEDSFPSVKEAFQTCLAEKVDADTVAAVAACAAGPKGAALIGAAAAQTEGLVPPHRYVPWLVVDGLPIGGDASAPSLAALVCAAYRGERPAVCTAPPPVAVGVGRDIAPGAFAMGRRGGGVGAARGVGSAVAW